MSSLQSSRASRYVKPLDGGRKVLERPMVFYGSRVDGVGDAAVRWLGLLFCYAFERLYARCLAGFRPLLALVWS